MGPTVLLWVDDRRPSRQRRRRSLSHRGRRSKSNVAHIEDLHETSALEYAILPEAPMQVVQLLQTAMVVSKRKKRDGEDVRQGVVVGPKRCQEAIEV